MPSHCSKSRFTGTHGWAVEKEKDEQGKSYEVVRCFFCHAPAPAEEAARTLEMRDENRRIKALSRIQTDSQKAAAANREADKKAQKKLV